MYYSSLVTVANSVNHLVDNSSGVDLQQLAMLADPLKDLTSRGHFHDHNHGLAFEEGVVQLNHVLVSEHLEVLGFFINIANHFGIRQLLSHINVLDGYFLLGQLLCA